MKNSKPLLLVLGSALLLFVVGTAYAVVPRITWDPNPLVTEGIATGGEATYPVVLKHTGYLPILAAAQLRIEAEGAITPYVAIEQPTFPSVFKRGQQVTFNVKVSVPEDAQAGTVDGSLVLKRVIRNKVTGVWRAEALAVDIEITTAKPGVAWSEEPLTVNIPQGTALSMSVDMSNLGRDLADVDVSVVPELAPYLSVFPKTIETFPKNTTQTISLWVSVPADTPMGIYDGTLHIKEGKETIATPLPIVLHVTPLEAVAEEPLGLSIPSDDRIVEDPESGLTLVKDEIMVTLEPSGGLDEAQRVAADIGGQVIGGFPELRRYQIQISAGGVQELIETLQHVQSMVGVDAAHGHYFASLAGSVYPEDNDISAISPPTDAFPAGVTWRCLFSEVGWNDAIAAKVDDTCLWGYSLIGLPFTWDISTGSPQVKIAVIDGGFGSHHDFADNVAEVSLDPKLSHPEGTYHGRAVAGIIGAQGNNATGMTGVMWDASLFVCGAGHWDGLRQKITVDTELAASCLNWANDRGAKIVNFSAGEKCSWRAFGLDLCRNLENMWSKLVQDKSNILFVTSAGNNGEDVDAGSIYLPAALASTFDNLVAVASIHPFGEKLTDSSNYGLAVAIAAPGVTPSLGDADGYTLFSGTSAAAPFVSGVAGLMLSVNDTLSAPQLKELLLEGAVRGGHYLTEWDGDLIYALNAYESVKLAKQPPASSTAYLEAKPNTIVRGEGATLTWRSTSSTSCEGGGIGFQTGGELSGSIVVYPTEDTTYSVTCTGEGEPAIASAAVTVTLPPPGQPTASLLATPTSIVNGESATLTWSSTNADACTGTGFDTNGLSNDNDGVEVSPTETTTYVLTCTGLGGTTDPPSEATVTVTAPPPPVGTWSVTPVSVSVGEGSGTVTFTVARTDDTTPKTVYVSTVQDQGSTNSSDYVGKLNEPFSFSAGQAQQSVTLTINEDSAEEGSETFGLIVQQLPTDPIDVFLASATFTIIDNDVQGVPIWPMVGNDAQHTGRSQWDGPQANTLKWKYDVTARYESILDDEGTIYVTSSGGLIALNPDGSEKWVYDAAPASIGDGSAIVPSGAIVIPVMENTASGRELSLIGLGKDGKLNWRSTLSTSMLYHSLLTVGDDGVIYLAIATSCGGPIEYYAVNSDGTLRWKQRTTKTWCAGVSTPAVGHDGRLYVFNGELAARDQNDGSVLWSKSLVGYCPPSVGPDGTIYVKIGDMVHAVARDGTEKWTAPGGNCNSQSGTVAIGDDGTVYTGSHAIRSDGTVKWVGSLYGAEAESGVAISGDGTVYYAGFQGWCAVDAGSGAEKWRFSPPYASYQDAFSSPTVGNDGVVYFSSYSGVYAFGAPQSLP